MPRRQRRVARTGPKRAVIYCRVSTTRQEDNSSLDSQERACRAWADQRGYVVVKVVREVHTGAEFWQRNGITEVRELMAAGDIEAVISSHIDGLARTLAYPGLLAGLCARDPLA